MARWGIAGAAAGAVIAAVSLAPALGDDQWATPDGDGGIEYGIELDPTDDYSYDGYDYSDDYDGGDYDDYEQLSPEDQLEQDFDHLNCYIPFVCPEVDTDQGGVQEEPVPPPNPADLGQVLLDRMPIPSPDISIAPAPPRPTLVQLWTWFWVPESQWRSQSESMSAGGITVTVTVEPESVTWNTGEGSTVCDGPGEPWTPGSDAETSSCGHKYTSTTVDEPGGKYSVSATMSWRASWTCEGACIADGGDLGTIESESESAQLEVRQRQSLVIE